MAIEFKTPAESALATGVKMLIYGSAGSGKTVTCVTAEEPTLIISAEAGLLSIKDAPDSIQKMIQIAECSTRADVEEVLEYLQAKGAPPWVCVDSISEIAEVVLAEELDKPSGKDPRKAYGELAIVMTNLIKGFRNLPNTNVVMTAKLDRVQDGMSNAMLYGPSMPGQKMGQALPYFFDFVGALRVDKDNEGRLIRSIQTNRDAQYEAKDRSGKLDIFEKPSLKIIKDKIVATPPKAVKKAKAA
tara:strand:+ start:4258 stop:4989 length:732 start_codon:yes stop_codon:yes gene_type:complete